MRKNQKKVAKVLDFSKNDDSDSGEILEHDMDDIPPVEEKTSDNNERRGAVPTI